MPGRRGGVVHQLADQGRSWRYHLSQQRAQGGTALTVCHKLKRGPMAELTIIARRDKSQMCVVT